MDVATNPIEVGVRDLKNNLSRYLDRVSRGEDLIVTDRGRPIVRMSAIDGARDHLAGLIAEGLVYPPVADDRSLPEPIKTAGTVSDLIERR